MSSDTSASGPGELVDHKPSGQPESPMTSGRPHWPSKPYPSRPGELVHLTGHRTRAGVPLDSWSSPRPSDLGPNCPGQLVDPARLQTQARITRDGWSTQRDIEHGPKSPGRAGPLWDHGPEPELPGRAGRHHGPSDQGPCIQGQLVDPAGPWGLARVAPESCSTPQDIGPKLELPWRAGGTCGP